MGGKNVWHIQYNIAKEELYYEIEQEEEDTNTEDNTEMQDTEMD